MVIKKQVGFYLLLAAFIWLGCKKDEYEIIPKDEFINMIVDLHQTDALMAQKGFSGLALFDSVPAYYEYIMEKYHVSREQFNNSISYYNEDLNIMLSIYDEVITRLKNKMPKKIDDQSIYKIFDIALEYAEVKNNPDKWFGIDGKELWAKPSSFSISTNDTANKADFKTKIKYHSLLMLKANVIVFNDDSAINQRMTLQINYKDSTFDKIEKKFTGKNAQWNYYQIFIKTDSLKKPESVECKIFEFDSISGRRHIMANNISLRQYSPYKDSTVLIIKNEPDNRKEVKQLKKNLPKKDSKAIQINKFRRQD